MSSQRARAPLREILARALPERPFNVELWDGSRLPSTAGRAGQRSACARRERSATFYARRDSSVSGERYVSGQIEVDDIDSVLELLDGYAIPPMAATDKARLVGAAARARGRAGPRLLHVVRR